MTTTAPRAPITTGPPGSVPQEAPEAPRAEPQPGIAAAIACLALLGAAILPLDRVFTDRSWAPPVASAAVLAFGVAWLARRLHRGPVTGLLVNVAAWVWFSGLALLPESLAGGFLPGPGTIARGVEAWGHGIELLQLRPAPAIPETGLVLITVTGVWAVAHAVHELVFRVHAPLRAVLMTLVLWIVPLGLAPGRGQAWHWAVPLLAAVALLLLASTGMEAARWGRWSPVPLRRLGAGILDPRGWAIAAAAIALGVLVTPLLPGWTDPALYELRDLGGSTLTTNPMVSIRANLLSPDPRPVLQVRTPRPVYVRTTSLDRYSDREEWTNAGIRGRPFRRGASVPFEVPIDDPLRVTVDVTVGVLGNAVLVPMPYQPELVTGTIAGALQYDQRLSTFTLNRGVRLVGQDQYTVQSAIPAPNPEDLDLVPAGSYRGDLLALPASLPAEVSQLARQIVAEAGATTPFRQALAIQDELRSWTYSLDPPAGHSGEAMRAFLRSRTGYCEQFAGTMAVMLRTLGIPARVGVGFTPGELIDPTLGQYQIRASNAHAWVEVLFPGEGWIGFEPTPRADGNVLVPSAANLAPSLTEAQESGEGGPLPAPTATPQVTDRTPEPRPTPTPAPGADGGRDTSGRALLWVGILLLTALGAGAVLLRRSAAPAGALGPADRVLHALGRVEAIALGLGRPRLPSETDREFLARLTRSESGPALAAHAERARYAVELPLDAIRASDELADQLIERLLFPLDRRRRVAVRWRARWRPAKARLRAGVSRRVRRGRLAA